MLIKITNLKYIIIFWKKKSFCFTELQCGLMALYISSVSHSQLLQGNSLVSYYHLKLQNSQIRTDLCFYTFLVSLAMFANSEVNIHWPLYITSPHNSHYFFLFIFTIVPTCHTRSSLILENFKNLCSPLLNFPIYIIPMYLMPSPFHPPALFWKCHNPFHCLVQQIDASCLHI